MGGWNTTDQRVKSLLYYMYLFFYCICKNNYFSISVVLFSLLKMLLILLLILIFLVLGSGNHTNQIIQMMKIVLRWMSLVEQNVGMTERALMKHSGYVRKKINKNCAENPTIWQLKAGWYFKINCSDHAARHLWLCCQDNHLIFKRIFIYLAQNKVEFFILWQILLIIKFRFVFLFFLNKCAFPFNNFFYKLQMAVNPNFLVSGNPKSVVMWSVWLLKSRSVLFCYAFHLLLPFAELIQLKTMVFLVLYDKLVIIPTFLLLSLINYIKQTNMKFIHQAMFSQRIILAIITVKIHPEFII